MNNTGKFILHSTPISDLKEIIKEVVTGVLENNQGTKESNNTKLYTRQEVSNMLGISLPTLDTYAKDGIIQVHKIGSQIRYKHSDVEKALKKNRSGKVFT